MKRNFMLLLFVFATLPMANAQNWFQKDLTGQNIDEVKAMSFTSATKGCLVASYFDGLSFTNYILKTNNGGGTWTQAKSSVDEVFRDIHFFDANKGIVCGSFGGSATDICRTTDGGATWACEFLPIELIGFRMHFLDANTGFIVGLGTYDKILKTTDGGANWTSVSSAITSEAIYGIDFTTATTGFAVGGNGGLGAGVVYKTTDGGNTWAPTFTDEDVTFEDVFFLNSNKGFLVGNGLDGGKMFKTTNGGNSWTLVTTPNVEIYRDIYFANSQEGFAVGGGGFFTGGTIIKTVDGGSTWETSVNSIDFSLNFNYMHHNVHNNRLYVTGPTGYLYRENVVSSTTSPAELAGITSFPNPANGQFFVETPAQQALHLDMINGMGQLVLSKELTGGQASLDISNQPAGTYFLKYTDSAGQVYFGKLLVTK